jgi:UPF0042 nucleotide-binding protein
MNITTPLTRPANSSSLELILITGMSGSGKSIALKALEDAGYYCVDNLPPELLTEFVQLELSRGAQRVALAMDSRSAYSLPQLPEQLLALKRSGTDIRTLFLDTKTATLIQRFSESRRRHPLSKTTNSEGDIERDLSESIETERELLAQFRDQAHIIDTSLLKSSQLQSYVKSLVFAPQAQLTLIFESFAFKKGIPVHADYVFDVRMLPNPYYEQELRAMSGKDAPVSNWLAEQESVGKMVTQLSEFLSSWLPSLNMDHRSYVSVAIGCTGGQHRSVYIVEELAKRFTQDWVTLKRHRELDQQS